MSHVTTTLNEPWQLTYDDMPNEEFVDGLRISTDCLARRVIEPLDPDRYHEFPEHLGHRGHGFERILQEWLLAKFGVDSIREVVAPWEYGETHLDLLLPDPKDAFDTGGRPLQIELKANKDAQVRTENVRQVQRQMFVVERAIERGAFMRARRRRTNDDGEVVWKWEHVDTALLRNMEWRVLVIDPTTWRIPDPKGVKVTISDDRRAELEREWVAMRDFMSLPVDRMRFKIESEGDMDRAGVSCSCGKCFRIEVAELDKYIAIEAAQYINAQQEVSYAKGEQDALALSIKKKVTPLAPTDKGHTWIGHGYKVTLSKPNAKGTRSIRVTESDAKVRPQL